MSDAGIFTGLDNGLSDGLDAVLRNTTATYASGVAVLFAGGLTLYIIWMGYQTLAGKLQTPVEHVLWELVRAAIILTFITNASGYLDAATAAINGLRDGFSGGQSVWALMDSVWAKSQAVGQQLFNNDDSTYVKVSGGLAEALVWGGTITMLVVATVVNLCAEVTLKLMVATAPVFIACLMFGWLRPMFNNWLQTILSTILTALFAGLSMQVAIDFFNGRMIAANAATARPANIVTLGAECCMIGVTAAIFIGLSAKLASMLAGVGAQGAMMGMAKITGSKISQYGGKAAGEINKGLGAVGNKAAENLKKPPQFTAQAISKAAVEKMKSRNK